MVTKVEKPEQGTPPGAPGAPGAPPPGGAGLAVESLDDLARAGAGLDAPRVDARAEQTVLASEREEIETALQLLRAAAVPLAADHIQEPLLLVWSDKQLREVAEALVACARASGITISDWFKGYGHWVQLGFALGLPAVATIKLLRMPAPPAHQVQQGQGDGQHAPA